jgi:HAE1 family hydrophobic/amphiphilic exporter-1
MFSEKLLGLSRTNAATKETIFTRFGNRAINTIMTLVTLATKSWISRVITIVGLTALSLSSVILLLPKTEYLPQGNRNLVISILIPPPGLSYEEKKEIGDGIFQATEPYIGQDHNNLPGIKNMFYVASEQFNLFGAISMHEQRAGELIPLFMETIQQIPGMFGISMQAGIFQTRLGRGRTVEVDISADDLDRAVQIGGMMFGIISQEIPGAQIRPVPSLELLFPEVRLVPLRDRLKASGMSAGELGIALDVLMDGRKVGEFKQEGEKKIDLVLKASEEEISSPEDLYRALITTAGGKIVPVSSLAGLERTSGITEIRHLERKRTITLQVTPPETVALQEAMEIIDSKVINIMKEQQMLEGADVDQSGVADKLTETREALQWNFLLAAVIAYLLMSALFGNFIYPLIIMFTVPLAGAGGFMGLALVNLLSSRPQPFDILTMLGFVILIGVVVNNAILIVHQSLNNIRYHGMDFSEAVLESTKTRLRPIYMSASTSIFGMLPLVVAPGPGSELYRGLGSVILGGLALSTVFTVFVIPSLLMFFIKMEKRKGVKS